MKNFINSEVEGESSCLGSIFRCYLFPCLDIASFKAKLEEMARANHKARHIPYAYIINNETKCSDDGEPNSTAGKPMLDFLIRNNMDNIGCIITRYYGGKDLGTGRLRSYFLLSLEEAYKKASFIQKELTHYAVISSSYDTFSSISRLAKSHHFPIKDVSYEMEVIFTILLNKEKLKEFLSGFVNEYSLIEEGDTYIDIKYLS